MEEIKKKYFRDGRLQVIPKKEKNKLELFAFFSTLFNLETDYSESEVNEIIVDYYDDYSIIRRYLVDYGFLERDLYGKIYKRVETKMNDNKFLVDMYQDDYYPNFLVDKIKALLKEAEDKIKLEKDDLDAVQLAFDDAVDQINELHDEFDAHGSEIETVARDSIAVTVDDLLTHYNLSMDLEEVLRNRDW